MQALLQHAPHPQHVPGPRFRTGMRTMTGPTSGGKGLAHMVNYLHMAGGGGVAGLAAQGQGPDDSLAHVSSDEIALLDKLRGGTEINPSTGLPQYGWLGNLLKGLVRAGAAIAGGMIAGPAGAAVGSGLATKLTGGSWNDALTGAAMSGIGGELTQGLSGGGWNPTQSFDVGSTAGDITSAGAGTAAHATAGVMDAAGHMSPTLFQGAMAGAPAGFSAGTLGSQFLGAATSKAGIAAGLGALSAPMNSGAMSIGPTGAAAGPQFSVRPMHRTPVPYTDNGGDLIKYGLGPMHKWYEDVNPPPDFTAPGAPGGVDYSDYTGSYADGGPVGLAGPSMNALESAVRMGYMSAAHGGAAHQGQVDGPGGGTDDLIPAQLSAGEHVITAREISALGGGNNAEGQKRMYALRRQILSKAGYKDTDPKKTPKTVRGLGHMKLTPKVAA